MSQLHIILPLFNINGLQKVVFIMEGCCFLFAARFFYTLWKKHLLLTLRAGTGWHTQTDQGSPVKKEIIFWKSPDLQLEPHLAPAELPVCSPAPGWQQALS